MTASSSPIHTVTLVCHPESRNTAVRGITACAGRMPGGKLAVTYILDADVGSLRVPVARPPRIVDGLWRHTCCEVFIGREGEPGYHEFNLAPSGEWAAYAFERYRVRAPLDPEDMGGLEPRIAVRSEEKKLELDAVMDIGRLLPTYFRARLALGLSVVVEDRVGSLSYWALKHPPGKPDFHHSGGFALELEEY